MKNIDYSKFKKTSQDKNSATLMHPDGHEIKIAISGLNPSMKKELMNLPLHQAESKEPITIPESEEENVDQIKETPQDVVAVEQQENQAAQAAQAPVAAAPVAQPLAPAPVAPQPAPAAPVEAPVESSATLPAFQSEKARIPETPLLVDESPDEHYAKEVAFQQDLANRHIEPKTYSSMFANRGTLGKIGTIFGLLMSGAGSGLTGQPNALLDMMNKEIDRDLAAQKESKANANTFLKTQIDHDLAMSNIRHTGFQNALIAQNIEASQAANIGLGQENAAVRKKRVEAAGGKWDDSLEKETAGVGSDLFAKNKMLSTAVQYLDDVTANNPAAKSMIQTQIKPIVDAQIQQNVIKATDMKKAAAANAVKAKAEKAVKDVASAEADVIDMNKYHKMLDSGNFNKSAGIPLNSKQNIDPADDPKIQESITHKTKIANNYKDVMDAYNAIASMPNAGEFPSARATKALSKLPYGVGEVSSIGAATAQEKFQRPRDQLIDALSQRLSANGASAETMEMMKKALSPTMFDTPETLKKGAELVHQHFDHDPNFHPGVLKKYGLDKELPKIKFDVEAAIKERAKKEIEKEDHPTFHPKKEEKSGWAGIKDWATRSRVNEK